MINLLDELIEHCLPEVLVEMIMDRIVAKSPNATVISCGDHIDMVQKLDGSVHTISVYIHESGVKYGICYELKDYDTNRTKLVTEPYEDIKQVILALLYECVYDMYECEHIIQDVYGYCFRDLIESFEADGDEDNDFDDISILLEDDEPSELDAYLSDMADAYEDVDDDDLPF
jgi:hypothetical protein